MAQSGTNPFIDETLWVQSEQSTVELIKKHAKANDKILDIGVGLGRILSNFPELDRYGMDISFGYLQVAKKVGIEVCYSLIEDMPYRAGLFDIALCTDVLEHVFDLNMCCSRVLDVLKVGGILIVRVPYREDLSGYLDPKLNPYEFVHMRTFDEFSLQLLFEKILKQKVIAVAKAGYMPYHNRMIFPPPLPRRVAALQNRVFFNVLRAISPSLHDKLVRRLFYPIEINLVVQKIR